MTITAYSESLDYATAPNGTLHLVPAAPGVFETMCGENIHTSKGKTWIIGTAENGNAATCLPCRLADITGQIAGHLANYDAEEGVDRCDCGCKYWERDHCVDCGGKWRPEYREED